MNRLAGIAFVAAVVCGFACGDYIEVRRPATVRDRPSGMAIVVERPAVGVNFALLDNGLQSDGYYHIDLSSSSTITAADGWIYRTLVRRFPGNVPASLSEDSARGLSADEALLVEASHVEWPTRDDASPRPFTVFGNPAYNDDDAQHCALIEHTGFAIYWDDRALGPRWTAIKLTATMVDANGGMKRLTRFSPDPELEKAGLAPTKHDEYKNLPGSREWARGHMVQFDDARGWGDEVGRESFYTSNITPQLQALNGKRWLALEELCDEYARDYGIVWIYTGPIFGSSPKPFAAGRRIPAPIAFYKIVVSPGEDGQVNVLAFVVPHREFDSSVELSAFVVSIDEVEQLTGINFLRDLPDTVETPIEKIVWGLWPDL